MLSKYEKSLIKYLCLFAILAGIFVFYNKSGEQIITQKEIKKIDKIAELDKKLDTLELEAKAVSIFDIADKKFIYGRNDKVALPFASLVKSMTISVALENLSPETVLEISAKAIDATGDHSLAIGEKWRLDDLAKFSLVSSSNVGAYIIGESVPELLPKMNQKAKTLGMKNTIFFNSTGLDINGGRAGAYGSAQDANLMALDSLIHNPEVFRISSSGKIILETSTGSIREVENTDTISDKIPNLLFSKTGYTNLAGGNLTVIFINKDNHRIAITILGSSKEGRFSDMEKLINVLYNS